MDSVVILGEILKISYHGLVQLIVFWIVGSIVTRRLEEHRARLATRNKIVELRADAVLDICSAIERYYRLVLVVRRARSIADRTQDASAVDAYERSRKRAYKTQLATEQKLSEKRALLGSRLFNQFSSTTDLLTIAFSDASRGGDSAIEEFRTSRQDVSVYLSIAFAEDVLFLDAMEKNRPIAESGPVFQRVSSSSPDRRRELVEQRQRDLLLKGPGGNLDDPPSPEGPDRENAEPNN